MRKLALNGIYWALGMEDDSKGAVSFQYECDRNKFFMDGCNAVLEWTSTSVNAKAKVRPCVWFRESSYPTVQRVYLLVYAFSLSIHSLV